MNQKPIVFPGNIGVWPLNRRKNDVEYQQQLKVMLKMVKDKFANQRKSKSIAKTKRNLKKRKDRDFHHSPNPSKRRKKSLKDKNNKNLSSHSNKTNENNDKSPSNNNGNKNGENNLVINKRNRNKTRNKNNNNDKSPSNNNGNKNGDSNLLNTIRNSKNNNDNSSHPPKFDRRIKERQNYAGHFPQKYNGQTAKTYIGSESNIFYVVLVEKMNSWYAKKKGTQNQKQRIFVKCDKIVSQCGTKILTIANLSFIPRSKINQKSLAAISKEVYNHIWQPAMQQMKFKNRDWNNAKKRGDLTELLLENFHSNCQRLKHLDELN